MEQFNQSKQTAWKVENVEYHKSNQDENVPVVRGRRPKERMSFMEKLNRISKRVWSLLLTIFLLGLLILIIVLVSVTLKGDNYTESAPTVLTHTGPVRGRRVVATDSTLVLEFQYIPYAVSPVGEKRWKHSSLLEEPWSGTHQAKGHIKCVQGSHLPPQGQEDCLHLSVRTPSLTDQTGGDGLPVIVWIHGGGLSYGYADDSGYSADADFTANVNAVTVNINYRLDLLGFLSVPQIWEDGQNYGNFGIHDAIVALQWVKKNIRNFGGDPSRVTIMGESSGGTIVLALVAAPKANGLFDRAVALSPVGLWKSTYLDAHARRSDFLQDVHCDGESATSDTRACLKSADVELLIKSSNKANRGWGFYDFPMSEGILGESMDYNVKEPTVLPYFPQDIPNQIGNRQNVQLLIGNTAQEVAYWHIVYGKNKLTSWKEAEDLLRVRLTKFLNQEDTDLLESIKHMYHFGKDSDNWWPQMFWDTLVTDIRATCPLNSLSDLMNTSPYLDVHRLYIEHRPSTTLSGGERWGSWHGWDTEAMFGFKYLQGDKYTEVAPHDKELETALTTLVRQVAHRNFTAHKKHIYLRNRSPWIEESDEMPRSSYCEFLERSGFEGWGWQN